MEIKLDIFFFTAQLLGGGEILRSYIAETAKQLTD
jgi:hypothetical protein